MDFSFLNNIKNDKTRITTSIILEKGVSGDIPFYMSQAVTAFKVYGDKLKKQGTPDTTKKISPEKHMMNMFKLLFVSNISFSADMLDSLVCLYLWNTKESLYRQIKKNLEEVSIYNKVLGKKNYSESAEIYKNTYRFLHEPDNLFLDPDEQVINDIFDHLENLRCSSIMISHVIPDESRIKLFNSKLKKKEQLFRFDEETGLMVPLNLFADANLEGRWEEF